MNKDKKLHLAAGIAIAMFVAIFAIVTTLIALPCIYAGFMSALTAGFVREFDGKFYGGKFDWSDLGWTALGGLIGSQAGWLALLAV